MDMWCEGLEEILPNAAMTSAIESKAVSAGVGFESSFTLLLMPLAVPLAGSLLSSAGILMILLFVMNRYNPPFPL